MSTNYIIFAADTETQTLYDDYTTLEQFNYVDGKLKQQEINKEKILDGSDLSKLNMTKALIKNYSNQKETLKNNICPEIVPYLIGYINTGWTTRGGRQQKLYQDSLITLNTKKINRHKERMKQGDLINDINYFLSDNLAQSAILIMFDDIVQKYQHLINLDNGEYTALLYFHNLKFDIRPILFQQFKMNPQNFGEKINILKTEGSVISYKFEYRGCRFELRDSFEILPESIESLGNIVGIPKLAEDDTYLWHHLDHKPEILKELRYFKHDILILKKSLDFFFNANNRLYLTASQMSYAKGKKAIVKKNNHPQTSIFIEEYAFSKEYRTIKDNEELKQNLKMKYLEKYKFFANCYYGGFVLVNQNYIGKPLEHGITYDVNSLYPSVMINRDMPNIFKVQDIPDQQTLNFLLDSIKLMRADYNFGVVRIKINKLKLKKGGIPCLPKKLAEQTVNNTFKPVINLSDLKTNVVYLSVLDLYHVLKNYDCKYQFIKGYYWGRHDMLYQPLKKYLEPLKHKKEELTIQNRKAERMIVKLQMNSFYGKFGQRPRTEEVELKEEYFEVDDFKGMNYFKEPQNNMIDFDKINARNIKNNIIAVAVTSYARDVLLSTMESINESNLATVAYCDTDSIHVYPNETESSQRLFSKIDFTKSESENRPYAKEIAETLGISYDLSELGKWKDEQYMKKGVYLANKKYWEIDPVHDPESPNIIKFAGISSNGQNAIEKMGFDKFSEIDTYGQFVLTNTAISLPTGIRIMPRNKRLRSE